MAQQQADDYKSYVSIKLPSLVVPYTSFYVSESNQILLPYQGGIYSLKDSLWFIPPAEGFDFTSFAINFKDTAFFAIANGMDSTEIFYVKSGGKLPIKKYNLYKLQKGIYQLIYKNDVCYVWGYSSKESKIGILTGKGIQWLLSLKGVITQVRINDSSEIFFALDKAIYDLQKRETVMVDEKNIFGFDFDKNQNLVVSCSKGIAIKIGNKLSIIAKNIGGLVACRNERIFVLPPKGNEIYSFYK